MRWFLSVTVASSDRVLMVENILDPVERKRSDAALLAASSQRVLI